jgi:hypothetical protein
MMRSFVVSHPVANYATGWGTPFRAERGEKQILRYAQDDSSPLVGWVSLLVMMLYPNFWDTA